MTTKIMYSDKNTHFQKKNEWQNVNSNYRNIISNLIEQKKWNYEISYAIEQNQILYNYA